MTPKTLAATLLAAVAAGTVAAVELSRDECADAVIVCKAEGGYTKSTVRLCDGDAPLAEGCEIVWMATAKTTKPLLGEVTKAPSLTEIVGGCACGPTDIKSDCTVDTGEGKRRPKVGEFLAPGTFSGTCPPRPCVEASAVDAPGSTMPEACGGKPAAAKVDPEAKP